MISFHVSLRICVRTDKIDMQQSLKITPKLTLVSSLSLRYLLLYNTRKKTTEEISLSLEKEKCLPSPLIGTVFCQSLAIYNYYSKCFKMHHLIDFTKTLQCFINKYNAHLYLWLFIALSGRNDMVT